MKRITLIIVVAAGLLAGMLAGLAVATPVSGVTSTLFAVGQFDEIDTKAKTGDWESEIETKGLSDLYVLENRIVPGGTFGWHSHPGPSFVIVKTGALTLYRGDDPDCTPHVFAAGSGFVDEGGDVHLVRNEGSIDTVVYVTSLVPRGAARRIDQPSPGNCPF